MIKKTICVFLVLLLCLSAASPMNADAVTNKVNAVYQRLSVAINGYIQEFDSYTINKNSYIMLEDIAYILNYTEKSFNISWTSNSNTIKLYSGKSYITNVAGIFFTSDRSNKNAVSKTFKIYLDKKSIKMSAYSVNGGYYFRLSDIAKNLNFGLAWDKENNRYAIITSHTYSPDAKLYEGYDLNNPIESELADADYLGLISDKLKNKLSSKITRVDFCDLIMTAMPFAPEDATPAAADSFKDTQNINVRKALKLGIITVGSKKTFCPNDNITKEEAIGMLSYFVNRDNNGLQLFDTESNRILYNDNSSLSTKIKDYVYDMRAVGILDTTEDNLFSPRSSLTVQDAIILVKRLYRELNPDKAEIIIGGKTAALGMTIDELVSTFGKPQRIEQGYENKDLMVKYVYNSNPENFFIAGICHKRVMYLYTNAKSFLFNKKGFGSYVYASYYWHNTCEGGIYYMFLDDNNCGKLLSIELKTGCYDPDCDCYSESKKIDYIKAAREWEQDIFDMTNAFRACYDAQPVKWNEKLAEIARKHCIDMSKHDENAIGHNGSDGRDPFERMKDAGIQYDSASENVAYTSWSYDKSCDLFESWVSSSGHRDNMIDPQWNQMGVGVVLAVPIWDKDDFGHWSTQDFINDENH